MLAAEHGQQLKDSGDEAGQTKQEDTARSSSFSSSLRMDTFLTGCHDIDVRVFGRLAGRDGRCGSSGGVVGVSAEGDLGLVLSLQMIARFLLDTAASEASSASAPTARIITTLPVAHVVRLLKGVLTSMTATATATEAERAGSHSSLSRQQRTDVLRRVLMSRIYASDDLWAVLAELEAGQPLRRLWTERAHDGDEDDREKTEKKRDPPPTPAPSILVFTEMDHHFKWIRLQGGGSMRVHEQYGQLIRRLRALSLRAASGRAERDGGEAGQAGQAREQLGPRPLILVLNGTMAQHASQKSAPAEREMEEEENTTNLISHAMDAKDTEDAEDRETAAGPQNKALIDSKTLFELAASLLQDLPSMELPPDKNMDVVRLCCREMADAMGIVPRYKSFMDYLCSLHISLVRLPGRAETDEQSTDGRPQEDPLVVVSVEHDEAELYEHSPTRFAVVKFARGTLADM